MTVISYDFAAELAKHQINLNTQTLETLQLNITYLCNQACQHCHVDASPKRTEMMSWELMEHCLQILANHEQITALDITGGAPELHPQFKKLVKSARKLGKKVMVRHNLTVSQDSHPQTGESMAYLPDFFAENNVEVISSLPYYQAFFTDKQRGKGVFQKSIDSLRELNQKGFGQAGSNLILHLVYNPVGAFLPASQESLEADYKKELKDKFGIVFNQLFTLTNLPIHRFKRNLERLGTYHEYMDKLISSFNPSAAQNVMCSQLLSVRYDGIVYDCDFNQMLDLPIDRPSTHIKDFDMESWLHRKIRFDSHCYGCTAGAGSSCTGTIAE